MFSGNNWGYENGVGGMGLGSQEEFYGCADIKITPGDGSQGPTTKPLGATTSKKTTTTVAPKSTTTAVYVPWWRTTRTTQPITTTRPTTTQPTTTTRRTTTKASAYPMGMYMNGYMCKAGDGNIVSLNNLSIPNQLNKRKLCPSGFKLLVTTMVIQYFR